jgi:hypothetical protein
MNPLKTIMQAARGAASLDEMLEMLSVVGIEADVQPVGEGDISGIVARAGAPGALLYRMDATLKGGKPLVALLILPAEGSG